MPVLVYGSFKRATNVCGTLFRVQRIIIETCQIEADYAHFRCAYAPISTGPLNGFALMTEFDRPTPVAYAKTPDRTKNPIGVSTKSTLKGDAARYPQCSPNQALRLPMALCKM